MHRLGRVLHHLVTRSSAPLRVRPTLTMASTAASFSSAAAAVSPVAAAAPSATTLLRSSSTKLKVACVQMTSGDDMDANIRSCSALIRQAAAAGARLICTPENTARMTALTQKTATPAASPAAVPAAAAAACEKASPAAPSSNVPSFAGHPVVTALSVLAAELNVWILIGSIAVRAEGDAGAATAPSASPDRRFLNRSVLVAPSSRSAPADRSDKSAFASQVVAVYDKLHLFDVPSLNGAESYLESARVRAGSEAVLVDCSSGADGLGEGVALGLSVCYDLRFPQLYRALAQAGASILTVPSAFTVVTGQAHWHALLRARAIETGCFVLAPAQVGTHPGARRTYGHSLIVSPWGEVLADAGGDDSGPGVVVVEIDLSEVGKARSRVPSLLHDRPFTLRTVS